MHKFQLNRERECVIKARHLHNIILMRVLSKQLDRYCRAERLPLISIHSRHLYPVPIFC